MTTSTNQYTEPWVLIHAEEPKNPMMASPNIEKKDGINNVVVEETKPSPAAETKPDTEKEEQPAAKDEVKGPKTNKHNSATPHSRPTLNRQATYDDWTPIESEVEERYVDRRRGRQRFHRQPSPMRQPRTLPSEPKVIVMLDSSATLLSCVNTYDGVADLIFPGRGSVYLATFPFSTKEVRQWSWLFNAVVGSGGLMEGEWMAIPKRAAYSVLDDEDDDRNWVLDEGRANYNVDEYDDFAYDNFGRRRNPFVPPPLPDYRGRGGRVRERSPYYEPINHAEIGRLLLSRALDTKAVPEDDEKAKDVRYWIVVQSRVRTQGVKLLIARSRKAAGMHLFYEALNGHSIVFVGAVSVGAKAPRDEDGKRKKLGFRCVENLEEARTANAECDCHIGIVC